MTVSAPHRALFDLLLCLGDALSAAHIEGFLPAHVVKVQCAGVGESAVNASASRLEAAKPFPNLSSPFALAIPVFLSAGLLRSLVIFSTVLRIVTPSFPARFIPTGIRTILGRRSLRQKSGVTDDAAESSLGCISPGWHAPNVHPANHSCKPDIFEATYEPVEG